MNYDSSNIKNIIKKILISNKIEEAKKDCFQTCPHITCDGSATYLVWNEGEGGARKHQAPTTRLNLKLHEKKPHPPPLNRPRPFLYFFRKIIWLSKHDDQQLENKSQMGLISSSFPSAILFTHFNRVIITFTIFIRVKNNKTAIKNHGHAVSLLFTLTKTVKVMVIPLKKVNKIALVVSTISNKAKLAQCSVSPHNKNKLRRSHHV